MSQQIQITGGAKVRALEGVITGTSGVLDALPINGSLGIPQLDVNGKILVSQLPNSVMEYQGTWNVTTNTPYLVDGVGNQGDVYIVTNAASTGTAHDFGSGSITFFNGDQAIYSGTIWQRASGATGTVTSVGLSTDGNAITIGSSPITTSGTITANFAGTNLQYINGAGNLTTFPTLISSIGLSMPSAFSVANSPLTANGTIAVTGAGYPSQYIRGDGTLADFPTSGGGGSSVSYYLNGGTSQGVIGGVTYYEMSKTADTGTGVDFPKSGDGLIVSFLTDAGDPAQLNIPAGNWNYEIYASMSSNGGTPQMYAELYVYNGTTFTLIATSSNEILYDGVNLNLYTFAMTVPATTLALTDRLAIKLYSTNSGGKTTTVHTQDSHLCQIITTFSTGITALNGLTAQVQYFATGTSGTDFNISSSTATHTFNIPDASATARGLITTGTQTIAGVKTFSNGLILQYNYFPTPSTGDIGLGSNGSGITITTKPSTTVYNNTLQFSNGSNSFLFPNATGTIALTSDIPSLSGYVPYTGATGAVNLGSYDLIVYGVSIGRGLASISTNTLVGNNGLSHNTTGYHNTAIGINSLMNNTTGYGNSSVGSVSSGNNTTGILNTSFGYSSLTGNISGNNNVAIGAQSLLNNTTGGNNTAIGTLSGINITTGSYNTIVGNYAGTTTLANNIVLSDGQGNIKFQYDGSKTIIGQSNNVLIGGTTDAGYKLDVTGTGRFSGTSAELLRISSTATNGSYLGFTNSGTLNGAIGTGANLIGSITNSDLGIWSTGAIAFQANGAVRLTVDGSGNLGLGVTPSAWNSSAKVLEIAATGNFVGSNGADTWLAVNSYLDNVGGGTFRYARTGSFATFYSQSSGSHLWYTAPLGTAGLPITFTQAMTLTASGRLLIGTPTEATYMLDVNGTGRFSGNITLDGTKSILGTAASYVNFGYPAETGGSSISISSVTRAGSPFAMSFNSNNGYSIGNSTGSNIFLLIASTGAATFSAGSTFNASISNLGLRIQYPSDSNYRLDINQIVTSGLVKHSFDTVNAGTSYTNNLVLDRGNVGIGTNTITQPSSGATTLRIVGTSTTKGGAIYLDSSDTSVSSYIYPDNTNGLSINTSTSHPIVFRTADTERMRITSGGDVLMGKSAQDAATDGFQYRGAAPGLVQITRAGGEALQLWRYTSNGKMLVFYYAGSEVGSISSNTYSLPSDLNFKKDITNITLGLNLITKLRPVHYRHKLDEDSEALSNGIIAQELEQSLLECGVEKNSLLMLQYKPNEKENESQYWVDYQKMIPILIKGMQEQQATITSLQDRLDKLENK